MIYPTTQQPIYILKNVPARSRRLTEGRVRPAAVAKVAADAAPAQSEAAASPVGSLGIIQQRSQAPEITRYSRATATRQLELCLFVY